MSLSFASSQQIRKQLLDKEVSDAEVVSYYTERVKKLNPRLNAYIQLETPPASLGKGSSGKLAGIPIAIKDNLCVKGWEITCGSRILKGFISPYHATVIGKLLAEGAVLLGRANMDEFAFGSSCETSCYGPTRNPWDHDRSPGGSSGGSAAIVAADLACLALGSDTGGSIRQPAAFCGVVGLKPTYGRVSRYGLVAFASSMDQIGPFARTVGDAALVLSVIAGFDPKDSTSADVEVPDYVGSLNQSIKGLRIGVPKEFFEKQLDTEVRALIQASIDLLGKEGAECVEIELPHTSYAVSVYYVIGPSEASSNLARFDGIKYGYRDPAAKDLLEVYQASRETGFGAEAKRRILLGTYTLSSGYYDAFYLKAMKARRKIADDFRSAFAQVDCIVTPTSPTAAFKLGEKIKDPLSMYLSDLYTISANLAGIPAMSVPCGFTKAGLPVGVQLMAKAFDETTLFRVGKVIESKTGARSTAPKGYRESDG